MAKTDITKLGQDVAWQDVQEVTQLSVQAQQESLLREIGQV